MCATEKFASVARNEWEATEKRFHYRVADGTTSFLSIYLEVNTSLVAQRK